MKSMTLIKWIIGVLIESSIALLGAFAFAYALFYVGVACRLKLPSRNEFLLEFVIVAFLAFVAIMQAFLRFHQKRAGKRTFRPISK